MKSRHLFTYDVRPGCLYRIPNAPDNVMFDLTWCCDQRCAFCYNPVENHSHANPPGETTRKIIQTLATWGVREILYLGGEPTIHPDFESILELGAKLGLEQRIVTNGGHINKKRANLLSDINIEVGVSLHSSVADIHDRLTGSSNSFLRAINSLDTMVEAGVRVFVQYSPTRLDKNGLEALAAMLSTRYSGVVRFIDVNRLLPYGEGAERGQSVFLDEDGWWNVMQAIGQLASGDWEMRVEAVPHCWILDRANSNRLSSAFIDALLASIRPCYMAISQLAFDPEGHFKLCPGGPPVGLSLLEVEPIKMWNEHPLLVKRRTFSFLPKKCVDYETGYLCKIFYECAGGCRSAAGLITGAADPLVLKL
ncbi:MAG: radical SAM protein [Desulfobacterales bacterium]|nr:radical SAM protein [Desulfobacterales bacterium]